MEAADWASLSDHDLLERRISKLGLRLEGTALAPLIRQLYDELAAHGLVFRPPCHVGDEWFVPVGIPAIFVPFFLVHDRLRALERTMMLEVEGGTPEWFMKLIRHEAAHAYAYAYQLPRKKKWQQTFGRTSRRGDAGFLSAATVQPQLRRASRRLVRAEPSGRRFRRDLRGLADAGLDWRKRYDGWKALQKLEYVDELMRSLAGKPPQAQHLPDYRVADHDCLNLKLKTYYARKRKLYEDSYPDFYDNDLRQLFARRPDRAGSRPAPICAAPAAADELRLPVDEREKISREQTPHAAHRPLRSARAPRAERRSAAGFSRLVFHHDAGDELSLHRQIQAHEIT